MRPILFFFLCFIFLTCIAHGKKRKGRSGKLSKNQVQKRFVIKLGPTGSIKVVKKNVLALRHHGRPAKCNVVRVYKKLRMLTVRCATVRSSTTSLLINTKLAEIPGVSSSTPDAVLTTTPTETNLGGEEGPETPMFREGTVRMEGEGLPYNWGLDRMDEEESPLDGLDEDFSCYPSMGRGVKIFVIDTGCMVNHVEFENVNVKTMPAPGSGFANGQDDHGHGTHIGAIAVGQNVGFARKAELTCIKSFNKHGNGAATDTISAVEYVMEERAKNTSVPYIVNLSYSALTGFSETPLDEMIKSATSSGIIFVVSAGNAAVNSCLFSPSKAELAFTVTASTKADVLEADSNIGPCVEFIAPGHKIVSAGIDSRKDYESYNGTSMATPHIVGLSALVLGEHPEVYSRPREIRDWLYEKLLTSRSTTVDGFIMPLMEIGCNAEEILAKRSAVIPKPSPIMVSVSPVPSASASPSAAPSPSSTPSPSPSPSPKAEHDTKNPEYWNNSHSPEMEQDLGSNEGSLEFYTYGFGPIDNPYEDSSPVNAD